VRAALAAAALVAVLGGGIVLSVPPRLPDFAFVNQDGRVVRRQDLRDRVTVVAVFFTRCAESCPLVIARLTHVQGDLRRAGLAPVVRFVSITVDPATDTPATLARYAAQVGADTRSWDFLTGPPEEIARVLGAVGVAVSGAVGRIAHGDLLLFLDARGRIVGRARGADLEPSVIVARIRRAVVRSGLAGPTS
jgi:cytochrome oxidase Cu insertion factor (SCO1/SenC/PrrC family)